LGSYFALGRGHNLYGESAWPSDIFFVFAPVVLALGAPSAGLAVACPPGADLAPAGPFLTPPEILPEYYLWPGFNLIRALGSKAAGVFTASALLARFGPPFGGEGARHFFQNPYRRPAAFGSCLVAVPGDLFVAAGAQGEIELSAPAPQSFFSPAAPLASNTV